jgi:hypothetical protein
MGVRYDLVKDGLVGGGHSSELQLDDLACVLVSTSPYGKCILPCVTVAWQT